MEFLKTWLPVLVVFLCCQNYGNATAPSELTPSLVVMEPYNETTELSIGQKTKLELTIQFPAGTTTGVIVEILPSTNVTVMGLGTVAISSIGSSIAGSITNRSADYFASSETADTGFRIYTRAVFDFGDVTNTNGGASGDGPHELKIQFEAYVATVANVNDNETHWTSAGVEYNNSFNVWIGQVSYLIRTGSPTQLKTPVFQLGAVNSTDMPVGTSMQVFLNIQMPYSNPDLSVEAISLTEDTSNTDLRVGSVRLSSVGENFALQTDTSKIVSNGIDCSTDITGSRRVRLNLPSNLVNKESLEAGSTSEADLLQFETWIYLKETATIGDTYPLGMGVEIGSTEVWVSYFNVTAADPISTPNIGQAGLYSPNTSVSINSYGTLEANVSVPSNGVTTFNITVQTRLKSGTNPPGLAVVGFNIKSSGANILCSTVEEQTFSSSSGSAINNIGFGKIKATNFGVANTTGGDVDDLSVEIILYPMSGFTQLGDIHEVDVTTDLTSTSQMDFTVVGEAALDTSVNYTFLFYHDCQRNCLSRGALFEFILEITTEKNTNPGEVTIEFPVPTNYTDSFFSVCSYSIVSIGRNLGCLSKQMINNATNISRLDDGTYDLVKVILPAACNLGLYSDEADDKIKISMLAQLRNDTGLNSDRDEWFGIGSRYSQTQVWVAQYKVWVKAPSYYPNLAIVEGIALDSDDLVNNTFLGVRGIEYSLDGLNFNDRAVTWNPGSGNSTHTVYTLQMPFMTSYVSMTQLNNTCTRTCCINHEFIVSPMDDYLEIFNDDDKSLRHKFPLLMDKNNDTCFDLPVNGTTPPLFWVRMNTTILNINFKKFELLVTGKGISCNKTGTTRVLQVSYPTSSSVNRFHGDLKFCDLISNQEGGSPTDLGTCKYNCDCEGIAYCEEVVLFMSNSDSNYAWEICEITATN